MSAPFIPGPWQARTHPPCIGDAEGHPFAIVAGAGEEQAATSRLIAEAPAMYALITRWIAAHEPQDRPCPCALCQAGRALVARVEGRKEET